MDVDFLLLVGWFLVGGDLFCLVEYFVSLFFFPDCYSYIFMSFSVAKTAFSLFLFCL